MPRGICRAPTPRRSRCPPPRGGRPSLHREEDALQRAVLAVPGTGQDRYDALEGVTEPFGAADAIADPIPDTAGVPFETIASLQGVQQLDRLDASRAMLLVDAAGGGLDLEAAALP